MAKSSAHYLKDGTIHNGSVHKMPDGSIHTNKTHTKTSKPVVHLKDLSGKARSRAAGSLPKR